VSQSSLSAAPARPAGVPATIAAFDVDGTLTWTDSFVLFLRFVAGDAAFAARMAALSPAFLAHKAGLVSRDAVKGRVVAAFFAGMAVERHQDWCARFSEIAYPLIARGDGLQRLAAHQGAGDAVFLVSASLTGYLEPWARALGCDGVLATRMGVAGDRLTGGLAGPNCWGPEKLARIKAAAPGARLVAAYGDSRGDREMLAGADMGAHRTFHDKPHDAAERVRAILSKRAG
jgi:phosphatidylglycerophosphatase C